AVDENATITALGTGIVSLLTLLVPTAIMGATLPVLMSYLVRKNVSFGKSLSVLYGINTLGAVMGIGLATFFVIGIFGERAAIYVGVAVNLVVAAAAFQISGIEGPCPAGNVASSPKKSSKTISQY